MKDIFPKFLIINLLLFINALVLPNAIANDNTQNSARIQHTVMFSLKHKPDSQAEKKFIADSVKILASIGNVKNFTVKRQINQKNNFRFCFSMIFESQKDYDFYNKNPNHLEYVRTRWANEVSAFLESDFPVE